MTAITTDHVAWTFVPWVDAANIDKGNSEYASAS